MLETLVLCLIGWMIGSFIVRGMIPHDQDRDEKTYIGHFPPGTRMAMTIHMEEMNGWWYGWFYNDDGTEVFVAQGTTYENALNNCKSRVLEKNSELNVSFIFEMKNANTTVQN